MFELMENHSAEPIRLFLLGEARIETTLGTIEPTAEIVFSAALYLILERSHPISRRSLANILWPNVDSATSSHRLRQTMLKLKRLGIPVADAGKTGLTLSGVPVIVDFEDLVSAKDLEPGNMDRIASVLPGYEPSFSESYHEWLESSRARVQSHLARMILDLIARHRVTADWPVVELAANKLLALTPYNEEATLALAEAYAMRGAKLDATRMLDQYLDEVGIASTDLRLSAAVMRKRINNRTPPHGMTYPPESPLLGRGPAMHFLGNILAGVTSGSGGACLVWGDAGIGKTRLLGELSGFAALQGVMTQRVRSRPSDPHRPLSVFVDLVPSLRSLRGAIGCSPETMVYLDRLTKGKAFDSASRIEDLDAAFVYARLERALFDLVDAVSDETPLMIVVDDAHWIDSVSLSVLLRMIERCQQHRVLFVLASRERLPDFLAAAPPPSELQLTPLDGTTGENLILAIVRQQGREIDKTYLDWCVQVAEGNPFFLEELAKQWMETGARHEAPPSLTSVVDQRIARLHSDAIQVLQTCSALEGHSTFDRIETILGYEPHRLLRAFNDLGNAGMLLSGQGDVATEYNCSVHPSHDLLAAAALRRLARPALAFLHRRVAGALEVSVGSEPSTALLWDCAKHWQLAGDSTRALHLAKSCGLHLMEVGLPAEAADAFERALSFCIQATDKIDVLTIQAKAYEQSSAWVAVKHTESVVRSLMVQACPTHVRHDELELIAIRACWKTDESQNTLEQLLSCLAADKATDEHRVKAGAMALMLQDSLCRHEDMSGVFSHIQRISTQSSSTMLARLEAEMVYHTSCGELRLAIDATERLLTIQREKEDQGDLFRHLCNASVPYRTAGMFDHAYNCLREAAAIAEAHRMPRSLVRALPMLGHLFLEQGRIDEAQSIHREITSHSTHSDDVFVTLDIAAISARLALAEGNITRAQSYVAKQPHDIAWSGYGPRNAYALALHVAVRLAAKEPIPPTTLRLLETAHLRSRRSVAQAFNTYVLYFAMLRAGESQRAEVLLREYQTRFRRESWPAVTLLKQVMMQTEGSDPSNRSAINVIAISS